MDEKEREWVVEAMGERSGFLRLLSSLYFKEVSEDFISALGNMPSRLADEDGALGQGFRELRGYLARKGPDPRTDLACDYARIFLAAGMYEGDAGCPFESIYTSDSKLIMQEARDEVRAIYLANEVGVDEALHLPEDHLSFELEFLAILGDRAAELSRKGDDAAFSSNLAVQRDFEKNHLLNWIDALGERVESLARFRFYPAIMLITQGYLAQDLAFLGELIQTIDDRLDAGAREGSERVD